MEQYRILTRANDSRPYAIYKKVERAGFWQQISKSYFYKKAALNRLNKILSERGTI